VGHIRQRPLKDGGVRYQAEVRLKGHPTLTAMFDRKNDAKSWIQKVETDIRCGRHHLYSETKRHTFAEALERYRKEQALSVAKEGHLDWWIQELGPLYLQDLRAAVISEKKQKLLMEPNRKGAIRTKSTCNRYLATLSHLMGICVKQWEWALENPARKISREKEPRERTRFLSPDERHRLAFGKVVRAKRLEKKLSQEELAALADLHFTYVSSVERGERKISLENIARLAKALSCQLKDLMPS
jgi:DNA-binding Xre family transcriptional regulator